MEMSHLHDSVSWFGDRRLEPHPDVVARRVGDEVVLVQLHTNKIYALNRTGARFWELISAGSSVDETLSTLLDEFDVSPAQLEKEVTNLVSALAEQDLILFAERERPSST